MSAYDEPKETCPHCQSETEANFVDVGVGSVQCGPYHCYSCGASEIGPELFDWYQKDRDGKTIYLTAKKRYNRYLKKKHRWYGRPVLRPGHPFSKTELETGYYQGKLSPYANTLGGILIDDKTAQIAYRLGFLDEKDLPNQNNTQSET